MTELKEGYVDAGGIRTRYFETGDGSPLLLIHGGGAGADGYSNFSHVMPTFGKHMRTIAVDMLGFGETDKPDPTTFSYTQQARTTHMINFIETMKLGPVSIIGNSMGGTTAAGVAMQRPDLVSKLVLMGAAVNASTEIMKAQAPVMAPIVSFDGSLEGVQRIIDVLAYDYKATKEQLEYRQRSAMRTEAIAANKAAMGWVRENGLCYTDEQLASIKCPVFIIAGKNDLILTLEMTTAQLAKIPQASAYFIPKCGHWVMIEHPEEFTHQTLRFFGFND